MGFQGLLWVNPGFLAGFLALVECTREREEFGCVLDVFSCVSSSPPYWFWFLSFLVGFLGLLAVLSMAEAWAYVCGRMEVCKDGQVVMVRCRLAKAGWQKREKETEGRRLL